ncbi:hypothetical protein L1887_01441 [Cichorium endivia]|nr:hypothetical protein L1887_01441 [Cichorium endivia]
MHSQDARIRKQRTHRMPESKLKRDTRKRCTCKFPNLKTWKKGLPPDGVLWDPPPISIYSEDSNGWDPSSILMNSEAEVTIASDKSTVDCFGISTSSPAPIYRGIAEEFEHSLLKINDVEGIEGSKIITGSSVPLMAFLLIFAVCI